MKKQIKSLLILIICLSLLLPVGVFAKTTTKITLTKKTYVKTGSGSTTVTKFKTNKGYAYCITPGKNGPTVGTKLYLKNTIKSGSLVYLLDKAGTSDSSFMITQLAVWKYANNFHKAGSSSNWAKANKLVSKAKKNSDYNTKPSVSLAISSSGLSESGNYYKSGRITVKAKNVKKNLKVKLVDAPKNAKIVDSKGKTKTSFKNGDIIYVMVPTSSVSSKVSFKIKISGTGVLTYVNRYKSKSSKTQELILIETESITCNYSANLTIVPVVRKCAYYNGKYYDKAGKVVDKTTYSIQCEKHSCEKVGDKYFGRDGRVVDKITFTKECEKHVCEIIDNTYFGKDGVQVDKVTYDKQCNKHVCQIVDDTYFGKDGIEVDEVTYDKQCNKHSCDIVGDTYFGKDGSVVDAETYKKQCEEQPPTPVVVPDTADFNGLIMMLIGAIIIGSTFIAIDTIANKS